MLMVIMSPVLLQSLPAISSQVLPLSTSILSLTFTAIDGVDAFVLLPYYVFFHFLDLRIHNKSKRHGILGRSHGHQAEAALLMRTRRCCGCHSSLGAL